MGAHRSQHFVPRTYLKHFASPSNPKAVGLFNISRSIYVEEAPVKSQCAKPFFYGKDELEDLLADIESKYDLWIGRGVLADPPSIVDDLDAFVHFFTIIQFLRTEYAAMRTRAQFAMMDQLSSIPSESDFSISKLDTSDTAMVRLGVESSVRFKDFISDLKLALIRNKSSVPFVTSDDPVAFANRFSVQRLRSDNFGFAQTGALFWLPFSPCIGALLYDRDAYNVQKDSRWWASLTRKNDARALNELIFLKARENIYFSSPDHFDEDHFAEVKSKRTNEWQSGSVLVPVASDPTGRTFERVDKAPPSGKYMITTSMHYPTPSTWPTLLRIRSPVTSYTDGSAIGYVRKGAAEAEGYRVRRVRL
jgi:hypothetical protein